MSKVKPAKIEEQLEKDFAESKQLFKVVFEHSPTAIIVMDSKERIVIWNPLAEKILGMARAELFNEHISSLFPPKEWRRFRALNICHRGMLSNITTKIYPQGRFPAGYRRLDVRLERQQGQADRVYRHVL